MSADSQSIDAATGGSTKDRILRSAQEVFSERGFDGASTREIAARAGVNISSLHYHWDSKETLYRGIFDQIFSRLVELVAQDISRPTSREQAREMIEINMGRIFDLFVADPTIPRLLLRRLIEDDEGEAAAAPVLGPSWATFQEWVQTFAGDRIPPEDVSFVLLTVQSVFLVSMMGSRQVTAILGGSIEEAAQRDRLRSRMIGLVENLMGLETSGDGA